MELVQHFGHNRFQQVFSLSHRHLSNICLLLRPNPVGCDATNACVWQSTKLHNLRVASFFPIADLDTENFSEFVSNTETRTMIADLKPLSNGTSSPFLHGAILDQLRGIGAPTWRDGDLPTSLNHLNIWVLNTDAGGDIAKCRRNIEAEVANKEHIIVWGVDCLMHQYHLMARANLDSIEHFAKYIFKVDPGYWRRLCSILSVWREKARAAYARFKDLDAESADIARRLPPRALVGRWGNITACENYVFGGNEEHVRKVLGDIASKGKSRKRRPVPKRSSDIDDAMAEAQEEYTQKMSSACLSVVTSMADSRMWTIGLIAQKARKPLDHFVFWLQKQNKLFHADTLGGEASGLAESRPAAICALVCYKAEVLATEFENILDYDQWTDVLARAESTVEAQSDMIACILTALIGTACAFNFRVVRPCKEYPRRLFLLIKDEPDEDSDLRRFEANHLLGLSNRVIDPTT